MQTNPPPAGATYTVNSPHSDMHDLNGCEVEVVRWITAPETGFDLEALPMVEVRVVNGELLHHVWPDELGIHSVEGMPHEARALLCPTPEQRAERL